MFYVGIAVQWINSKWNEKNRGSNECMGDIESTLYTISFLEFDWQWDLLA